MVDIISPTLKKATYNGPQGNFSLVSRTYEANGVNADDKIRMMNLPIGTTIHGYRLHYDGMGAGVSLQLVVRQQDGTETALNAAHAANNAGSQVVTFMPKYIGQEGPSELVCIVTGGIANGTIVADLELVATGY